MQPLPIDAVLGEITRTLREAGVLVLEAPPGAGKTTRVPWALQAALGPDAEVLVTEPRRLAARLAARRVADEHGERLGERVGYNVRFEDVGGKQTRIRYVTEGILVRRLLADPKLPGVSAVVLDEFHERHLDADLLLVLLKRLRASERPDLRLVVMSATLDAEPVAAFLGAPRLRSEGRLFPVNVEFAKEIDDRPLEKQVTSAVRRVLDEERDGDILVFLPGAGEIRRAGEALATLAGERGVVVLPLHGDLPIAEQARAVEPQNRRKVVLSTNVAESSLTIDGVTAVIDSGLARVASHSAWSGVSTLSLAKISRASATQRAGRAGRTREGRVLRLYTRGDFEHRPAFDAPEVERSDLSEAALALRVTGVKKPAELDWLTAPPAPALSTAEELLLTLGAVTRDGELTETGRRLIELPLHPRLARIAVEGERRGVAEEVALVAALIGERDIRASVRTTFGDRFGRRVDASGPSDLLELVERFAEASHARFEAHRVRGMGLEPRAVEAVERARRQLVRKLKNAAPAPESQDELDRALLACVLAGFSDRLARRRKRGEPELVLANGRSAKLAEYSVVHDAPLLVAVDAEEQPGRGTIVRSASAVDENALFDLAGDRIEAREELVWVSESERVERVSALRYGVIALDETRGLAPPGPETARVLLAAAREQPNRFLKSERALGLSVRWSLLAEHFPKSGLDPDPEVVLERAFLAAAEQASSFAELEKLDWLGFVTAALSAEQRRLFETEVPERVRLGGGREVSVHYEAGKPPWIESRLQDFFGAVSAPRILAGRAELTLHLLAPNQRAVQVTTDLGGFWERHYPAIRRELMRRYPRHFWPEDARNASPPPPRQR